MNFTASLKKPDFKEAPTSPPWRRSWSCVSVLEETRRGRPAPRHTPLPAGPSSRQDQPLLFPGIPARSHAGGRHRLSRAGARSRAPTPGSGSRLTSPVTSKPHGRFSPATGTPCQRPQLLLAFRLPLGTRGKHCCLKAELGRAGSLALASPPLRQQAPR